MKSKYVVSVIAALTVTVGVAIGEEEDPFPKGDRTGLATLEYVDATVQEKIAPGTTGSVVVYDGVDKQTNQPQFSEVAVFDGTNTYDESTDYDKFITTGPIAAVTVAHAAPVVNAIIMEIIYFDFIFSPDGPSVSYNHFFARGKVVFLQWLIPLCYDDKNGNKH